jgi:hypothetical protein
MRLENINGQQVINFLKKELNVNFPEEGFLAGQSVCSALLYMTNKDSNFFANDLDVFVSTELTDKYFSDNLKLFKKMSSAKNRNKKHSDSIITPNKFNTNLFYKEIFTDLSSHNLLVNAINKQVQDKSGFENLSDNHFENMLRNISSSDGSMHSHNSNKDRFYEKMNTAYSEKDFFISTTQNTTSRRHLVTTFRDELFNYVVYNHSVTPTHMDILKYFDINCTQVGIDLYTKEIVYTTDFLNFFDSKQIEIIDFYLPYHTISRYFKKRDELYNFYGNNEVNSLIINSFLKMSDKDYSKICNEEDNEFLATTKITSQKNNIIIPNFGKDYKNKVNASKSIKDFYNLKEVKENALFNLQPRGGDVIDDLFNGKYKSHLERRLGTKIINYNGFIINNFAFHSKNCLNLVKKNSTNVYINNIKRVVTRVEKLRTEELKLQCKGLRYGRVQEISNACKFLTFLTQSQQETFDSEIKSHELTKIIKFVENHEKFLELFEKYNLKEIYEIYNSLSIINSDNVMHIGHVEVQINSLLSLSKVSDVIARLSFLHVQSKKYLLNENKLIAKLFEDSEFNNVTSKELVKTSELTYEGQVLNHCVGGYSYAIRDGRTRILSFVGSESRATLEINKDYNSEGKYSCGQFLSNHNSEPDKELWKAVYLFSLKFEKHMDMKGIIKKLNKKISYELMLSLCKKHNPEIYEFIDGLIEYTITGKHKVVEKPASCIYENFLDDDFF